MFFRDSPGVSGWIVIWGSSQELYFLLYSLQVQDDNLIPYKIMG